MAALPLFPVMPGTGPLQVVQLSDVVATVSFFLQPEAPARLELELAGPQKLSFGELVATYRRWFGWRPARTVSVPQFLASFLFRLGDVAGLFGFPSYGCRSRCASFSPEWQDRYHKLFWTWFAFGFPAFAAVIAIFWPMISRPSMAW